MAILGITLPKKRKQILISLAAEVLIVNIHQFHLKFWGSYKEVTGIDKLENPVTLHKY